MGARLTSSTSIILEGQPQNEQHLDKTSH